MYLIEGSRVGNRFDWWMGGWGRGGHGVRVGTGAAVARHVVEIIVGEPQQASKTQKEEKVH